jgi:hypothetical protein
LEALEEQPMPNRAWIHDPFQSRDDLLDQLWSTTTSPRDALLELVKHGQMEPDDAEKLALIHPDFGPLSAQPDPSLFDPRQDAHWDLPMMLEWEKTRNLVAVRRANGRFREQHISWHPVASGVRGSGFLLMKPKPYDELDLCISVEPVPDEISYADARNQMWQKAERGEIVATAIPVDGERRGRRCLIPRIEWPDLCIGKTRNGTLALRCRRRSDVRYEDVHFDPPSESVRSAAAHISQLAFPPLRQLPSLCEPGRQVGLPRLTPRDDLDHLVKRGCITRSRASAQRKKNEAKFLALQAPAKFLDDDDLSRLYDEIENRAERLKQEPATAKRKRGRRNKYTPAQLAALKSGVFGFLEEYGDPESDNPHAELKSISDVIKKLQEWATDKKEKDFPEEPARETIRPHVNEWLEEWRKQQAAEN